MCTLRAPISAIVSSAITKSSSSSSSWPTSCSASCWFGETSHGSASMPLPQRLALRVEDDAGAEPRHLAHGVRVEALVDAARQRAGEHDRRRAPGEVAELVEQDLELVAGDLRAPLVDLGVGARGRVDDGRRRARLVADPDEVVEDRLLRQLLDDPRARAAAGEPGRDDRHVEPLQRPRDVDALAAGEREHAARPVPVPELEDRDGQRAVERGVEGDGDDHGDAPSYETRSTLRNEPDEMVDGAAGVPRDLAARSDGRNRRRPRRAERARSAYRPRRPAPRRRAGRVPRGGRAPS